MLIFIKSLAVFKRKRKQANPYKENITKMRNTVSTKTWLVLMVLLGLCMSRAVLASTSTDVDLSSLDSSVEGHIQGDWGRLVAYIGLGLGIIWAAIKQNYLILMGAIVILLAIAFLPQIIDAVTGG